jgi:hypothetical protein
VRGEWGRWGEGEERDELDIFDFELMGRRDGADGLAVGLVIE